MQKLTIFFNNTNAVVLSVLQATFFENGEDFGVFYKVKSTYEM